MSLPNASFSRTAEIVVESPDTGEPPADAKPTAPQIIFTRAATAELAKQVAKHFFGLKQSGHHQASFQNVANDDYEARLPEDKYGEETAPNARVWRVYNEEAAEYDTVMVGQDRDGLDVMLVFVSRCGLPSVFAC